MTFLAPNAFISDSGAVTPDEAAVSIAPKAHADTAADLSQLMEIADSRFVLDVRLFVEALDPSPLFLRRAG